MKLASQPAETTLLTARAQAPAHTRVLFAAFFVSGFCALLYQTAWQRLLGLFTGADVRSVTIIVAAYLAGLGVGSLLGGLVADRLDSRRAVQLYGLCNLGIATFALATRLLFYDLLFLQLHTFAADPAVLIVIAVVSLLLPTTLMGLSLPLLTRALARALDETPQLVGRLEATNILGATMGALVGGWFLIGTLGFDGASFLGALLSASVAAAAFGAARAFPASDGLARHGPTIRKRPTASLWGWCALVCASGFLAIGLQVIWFRLLSVPVQSQAYTFATLVAIVLLGDGIGTSVGARLVRRVGDVRRLFLLTQGAVALYALGSVLVLHLAYATFDIPRFSVGLGASDVPSLLLTFGLPLLLMLPPSVLIGLTLPLVQKAVQVQAGDVGRRVGLLQVANLVGNVAGAVLTGILLLDTLGTAGTLALFGMVGLGFVAAEMLREQAATARVAPLAFAGAIGLLIAAFPSNTALWSSLHGGAARETIVAEDSTGVTVLVAHEQAAVIHAGGEEQGRIPFLDVHAVLGAVPALSHPKPTNVLIIGIGSGGTPTAAGLRPETMQITAVELVGSQLPALGALAETNHGAPLGVLFGDPRYTLEVGDGRRALSLRDEHYDLVQADAIQPWKAGSGLLYSREFFEQARERLAPGGVMAQWTPTTRTRDTFMAVFPYGAQIGDILMIGGNQPVTYDPVTLLARLHDERVQAHLARSGIDIERVRAFVRAQPVTFWTPQTARNGTINTDLLPRDEYFLNR
jgi:spermidine synthase